MDGECILTVDFKTLTNISPLGVASESSRFMINSFAFSSVTKIKRKNVYLILETLG